MELIFLTPFVGFVLWLYLSYQDASLKEQRETNRLLRKIAGEPEKE